MNESLYGYTHSFPLHESWNASELKLGVYSELIPRVLPAVHVERDYIVRAVWLVPNSLSCSQGKTASRVPRPDPLIIFFWGLTEWHPTNNITNNYQDH